MSNKNTRKDSRTGRSPQRRYQNTSGRRRIVASILAIVIALAVFVAYVIEVGMFASM